MEAAGAAMGNQQRNALTRRLVHFVLILIGTASVSILNFYQHHHSLASISRLEAAAANGVPHHVLPSKPAESTASALNETQGTSPSSSLFRILQPATTAASSSSSSSSVCQQLLQTSPLALWTDHIDILLEASRLPRDKSFKLRDKTAHALQLITSRLPVAQKAWSQQHVAVSRLVDKLQQHVDYYSKYDALSGRSKVNSQEKDPPPKPIQIVVLGGSITAGINCFTGVPGSDIHKCAWSARLESMLNQLFLATGQHYPHQHHAVVQVHNLAMSGTNTATGNALWNYDMLLPPPNGNDDDDEPADIVINAYATNDMHVKSILEAADANMTLHDKVFDMSQDFARTVMKSPSSSCSSNNGHSKQQQPLLIWLDDYLGNEQREILATTEYAQGLSVLSNYYGFSFVSYADAVRPWVYGDTHEGLFSPGRWYKTPTAHKMQREIHPSQGMHMSTAWLLAYHLLELTHQHCTRQAWDERFVETPNDLSFWQNVKGLSTSDQQHKPWPSPPKDPPRGLPPLLTADLRLDQVSDAWKQDSDRLANECNSKFRITNDNNGRRRCPFAWVSGIYPNPQIRSRQKAIEQVFVPHVVAQNGWELKDETGRGDRIGWVASDNIQESSLVMEWSQDQIPNLDTIETIGLFFLKSYGLKWANSTAAVMVQEQTQQDATKWSTLVSSHTLSGLHEKRTSEMYSSEIKIVSSQSDGSSKRFVRTKLRVIFTLENGSTFKLLGLAICR